MSRGFFHVKLDAYESLIMFKKNKQTLSPTFAPGTLSLFLSLSKSTSCSFSTENLSESVGIAAAKVRSSRVTLS